MQAQSPDEMPESAGKSMPRSRWHWIYFGLATFDLLTVCFSLLLSHRLGNIHAEAVRVDQMWSRRQGSFTDLERLATLVVTSGKDVFASRDVDRESARLEEIN